MKYYCTDKIFPGLVCSNRTADGRCAGGWLCDCIHKSKYPPVTRPPMPPVKPPKNESTDCKFCEHIMTCKYKNKFNSLKEENYPVICECVHFKKRNPLQEV